MPKTVLEYDGPEWDVQGALKPERFYLLCTVPRSGSTLLAQALWKTGVAGAPHEYFNPVHTDVLMDRWSTSTFEEYLARLLRCRTGTNGVFGFKMHFFQLNQYWASRSLESSFPGLQYVYIRRRDRVRQAISWTRAAQTQAWAAGIPEAREPVFDPAAIQAYLAQLQGEEAGWERFFAHQSIRPLRVVYEQFTASYEHTIEEVLRFLGIDAAGAAIDARPPIARQADDLTEQWVQRFREEAA